MTTEEFKAAAYKLIDQHAEQLRKDLKKEKEKLKNNDSIKYA